jgi:hypothetical protein
MESSAARMNRLGQRLALRAPLSEATRIMARFDAVRLDDLRELVDELGVPEGCRPRGSDRRRTRSARQSPPSARAAEAVAA